MWTKFMDKYFKRDLVKLLILTLVVIVFLTALTIWDNKTGILEQLAARYF